MINIILFVKEDLITAFEISGHATASAEDENGRLICSAVSSAAIMAANTVTEVIGDDAEVDVRDGYLRVAPADSARCADILSGLALHLSELQGQYPNNIKLLKTEV